MCPLLVADGETLALLLHLSPPHHPSLIILNGAAFCHDGSLGTRQHQAVFPASVMCSLKLSSKAGQTSLGLQQPRLALIGEGSSVRALGQHVFVYVLEGS